MKSLLLPLLLAPALHADLTLTPAPANRGQSDTAYAIFDSLDGLSFSNATGTSAADYSHNLTDAVLSQAAAVPFPGGVKLNNPEDFRVYTFTSATDWTISATPDISYNTATLRIHEYGGAQPGTDGEALPDSGLTDYTFTLNTVPPTSLTSEVFIFEEGTERERYEYVTTAVWNLSESTTSLSLNVLGYQDAHDSIDSFVLDLETIAPEVTPPAPSLTVSPTSITVSWPNTIKATLQKTEDLSNPESWSDVVALPNDNGTHFSVILPPSNVPTFFQLSN